MKNKKGKSFLGMLLLLIAIGVFGYFGYSTMNQIKLGLDLAGGVSITYQAKEENPSSEDMADTIYKLQQRVQNYSTEAEVYQEGNNRINVDIPGVSDADAIRGRLSKCLFTFLGKGQRNDIRLGTGRLILGHAGFRAGNLFTIKDLISFRVHENQGTRFS